MCYCGKLTIDEIHGYNILSFNLLIPTFNKVKFLTFDNINT